MAVEEEWEAHLYEMRQHGEMYAAGAQLLKMLSGVLLLSWLILLVYLFILALD